MAPTYENHEVLQTKHHKLYNADDVMFLFGFVLFICIIGCTLCDQFVARFLFQIKVTQMGAYALFKTTEYPNCQANCL